MKKATIAGWAFAALLVLLALVVALWALRRSLPPVAVTSPVVAPSPAPTETHPAPESYRGFLYGRVTVDDGTTYEGRLRFGGDEEAFWGDYYNGFKDESPWVAETPPGQLEERRPVKIFGLEVAERKRRIGLRRPFMARFGDIVRIEPHDGDVRVTLKSGSAFDLDRSSAGDFGDDLRVWDRERGVIDLDRRRVRTIELLPTPASLGTAPYRLHGTVRTRQGDFTGYVQWNREACVGDDELDGLRFDTIRSIARDSPDSAVVTLLDDRAIVLSDTPEVGHDNRGIYVDDPRYGRVLISWDAFVRADFGPGGSGPAYADFPPGRPLTGSVTTRAGERFTGRLVYDLDESETTETLDAPSEGVHYTIPFGRIASIVPPGQVTLLGGEELRLERSGDLGEGNAGMLIFVDGRERVEHVPWSDVQRVELDGG
jgi:hypothetical protein